MNALRRFVGRLATKYAMRYSLRDPDFVAKFLRGDDIEDVGFLPANLPVVWACMRVCAEDLAKLPLISYRRLDPRGKERIQNDPRYAMLHDSPNPEMSAFTYWETVGRHVNEYGNHYSEIVRLGGGMAAQLWPLNPGMMRPVRDGERLIYKYRTPNGIETTLEPSRVFHVPGPSFDGVIGLPTLTLARTSMTVGVQQQEFQAAIARNGLNPSGVLEHPGKLSPQAHENLRTSYEKIHSGSSKAGKALVLQEGMKYTKISMTLEDAEFLASRKFQNEEICRWFRVTPYKVGILDHATFSNIEHLGIEHAGDAIMPMAKRIEGEIKRKIFPEPDLFAEFLLTGLLRGDMQARAAFYQSRIITGQISPNDARELENENPIEDPAGDAYYMQGAMVRITDVPGMGENGGPDGGSQNNSQPVADNPDDATRTYGTPAHAFVPIIRETWRAILRVERDKLARAEKRGDAEFRRRFLADQSGVIVEMFKPVVDSLKAVGIVLDDALRAVAAEHVAAECVGDEQELTDRLIGRLNVGAA